MVLLICLTILSSVKLVPLIKSDVPALTVPINVSQKFSVFGSAIYFTGETQDISCSLLLGGSANIAMPNST